MLNLLKRGEVYYLRAQVGGKRYLRSLDTAEKSLAKTRAREWLKAARAGRWDALEASKARTSFATLGEVRAVYMSAGTARRLRYQTLRDCWNSLALVVRTGRGAAVEVDNLSTTVLTRDLVETYARAAVDKTPDHIQADRSVGSTLSTLRQARAVFSRWALDAYRVLHLPILNEFLQARAGLRMPAHKYRLPAEELRTRTLAAAEALRKYDPELYIAFGLCFHLGLRAGEAAAAQWAWIRTDGTRIDMEVICRSDWRPKGGERTIPIHPELYSQLTKLRTPDLYILAGGTPTARSRLIKRDLAKWMRGLGWSTQKAAHELRKWQGSRWYTERNAETAQYLLGHKDISTTCKWYADLARRPEPLSLGA